MTRAIQIFSLLLVLFSIAYAQQPESRPGGKGAAFFRPLPPARDPGTFVDVNPECEGLKYRTITGRCTSLVNPERGEAGRVQTSYFNVNSAQFRDDGLPNPRLISNIVANQEGNTENSAGLNELFTFFGQFIDHDLVLTPVDKDEPREIEVSPDDPDFKSGTLGFFRSEREDISESSTAERPTTLTTSALDLSQVYGTNDERNEFIRLRGQCELKTSGDDLLPFNTDNFVNAPSTSARFFLAGDTRANETPMLTAMHTIWLREHNRICGLLQGDATFAAFDKDELYEMARAITIAEYQKIVFNEWLPALLGSGLSRYRGYDESVDPTVSIEFSTAAFRVGHTLVGSTVSQIDSSRTRLASIPAADMFFIPGSSFSSTLMDNIVRGASATSAQELDAKLTDTLRNFLFENVPEEEGFDLLALNLQRSRDHNLPSYNELRERFHNSKQKARRFNQISRSAAKELEEAYGDVDKVEAWIGLMAEDEKGRSAAGPTLSGLLRAEFERIRNGDQFYYQRAGVVPEVVLNAIPALNEDIFSRNVLFNKVLIANTGLTSNDIAATGNAFLVRASSGRSEINIVEEEDFVSATAEEEEFVSATADM